MSNVSVPDESAALDRSDPISEPLQQWERVSALIVGLSAGAVGGYAVFKSANQAGTAALLVISVIFLLIGIQGTSLIRFASGSNSVEMERRRRNVAQALAAASEERSPEKALGIIEGAAIAEPRLVHPGILYEGRVSNALTQLGYRVSTLHSSDLGFDLMVHDNVGRYIYAEVKYYPAGLHIPAEIVRQVIGLASIMIRYAPVVLISNVPLTELASDLASESEALRTVIWDGERDNERLVEELSAAFARSAEPS